MRCRSSHALRIGTDFLFWMWPVCERELRSTACEGGEYHVDHDKGICFVLFFVREMEKRCAETGGVSIAKRRNGFAFCSVGIAG